MNMELIDMTAIEYYQTSHTAPFHFPVTEPLWLQSMNDDVDSDGRKLFDSLTLSVIPGGMIQYGHTAFGFDENGEISGNIHYPVIRDIVFDDPASGQKLLDEAMSAFDTDNRIHAFFHYFGMSSCARHGKLHEAQAHVHDLLLKIGFVVEHENVYYSKVLDGGSAASDISFLWREESSGSCREFAASLDGQEVCWGQVHFLPQGDIAYLRWIFTDGSRQHQGIGLKVMHALFCSLYQMGIRRFDTDTAKDNLPAQKYYEKCGFTNEGITRSYFTK